MNSRLRHPATSNGVAFRFRPWAAILGIVGAACNSPTGYTCLDDVEIPGIVLVIQDSATGLPLAQSAKGAVTESQYTDSLVPYRADGAILVSRAAAFSRPGTYDISVEHQGYLPWHRTAVLVEAGPCGPVTKELTTRMVPE